LDYFCFIAGRRGLGPGGPQAPGRPHKNAAIIDLIAQQPILKVTTMANKKLQQPAAAKKSTKKLVPPASAQTLTAKHFIERLKTFQSAEELKKMQRYFKSGEGQYGYGDEFMGVKMGQLFKLAIEFNGMPVDELEKLLESNIHEVRAGAISIMDKESRTKKIIPGRLKAFYELYMRRHDRINNWDLVDLGCLHMTGSYLFDKPRKILYRLAKSKNIWERRTAILSTCYFLRQGDTADTFKIAVLLLKDKEDLIHKATGWMLRFAGDKAPKELLTFLDAHAATMPRTMLRGAIEKLLAAKKKYYMNLIRK